MHFITLFGTAIGLSMDAFAVAMCLGLNQKKFQFTHAMLTGLYFGFFQALMPLIGYFMGIRFTEKIEAYDHWIAFGLLGFLGLKMIYASMCFEEENQYSIFNVRAMLILSVATSIDALAVGISFGIMSVNIVKAVSIIGVATLILSALGVKIGNTFGKKYKSHAELLGGFILIGIGFKILVEGFMVS